MHYCGILMYGVNENDLSWPIGKDEEFSLLDWLYENNDEDRAVKVKLKNGKTVPLFYEVTEDENYFGYEAGYPWEFKDNNECDITEQDVADAIVQYLTPIGYRESEIRKHIDYISTYDCC